MKPLSQKSKDRLAVLGLIGLEAFFIFGAASNYYRYFFLNISIDIYLAIFSTIITVVLTVALAVLLVSYLDKRKFLKNTKQWKA